MNQKLDFEPWVTMPSLSLKLFWKILLVLWWGLLPFVTLKAEYWR